MAKKANLSDPFAILNSELNGRSVNVQSTPVINNPPSYRPPTAPTASQSGGPNTVQNASPTGTQNLPADTPQSGVPNLTPTDAASSGQSGGSGCIGYLAKGALIIFLAAMLAWIIFMPSGSLSELKDYISDSLFGTADTDNDPNGYDFVTDSNMENTDTDFVSDTDWTETEEDSTTAETTITQITTTETTASTAAETVATTIAVTAATTAAAKTTTTTVAAEDNSVPISQNITILDDADYIYVYLKSQVVVVYDSDDDVRIAFTCSSGKASTPTKTGNYKILNKYRWRLMIGNCYTQYASSFTSGYLFHSIPYNKRNAGTMSNLSYDKLGTPASAGCVRLCFRDAKWIYDNCPVGTFVKVVDEYAPADIVTQTIIPRINDTAHSGWDPTDTSDSNPYND